MKKLSVLTLALLASGNMFGAADNKRFIKNLSNDSLIMPLLQTVNDEDNRMGKFSGVNKNVHQARGDSVLFPGYSFMAMLNLENVHFGDKGKDDSPFPVFHTLFKNNNHYTDFKNAKRARFVSPQTNGPEPYYIIKNKWDNDTDYVIISEEDLKKPEWQ